MHVSYYQYGTIWLIIAKEYANIPVMCTAFRFQFYKHSYIYTHTYTMLPPLKCVRCVRDYGKTTCTLALYSFLKSHT